MKIWWKFFGKSFSTSDKNWKEEKKKSCVKKSSSKERKKVEIFCRKERKEREKKKSCEKSYIKKDHQKVPVHNCCVWITSAPSIIAPTWRLQRSEKQQQHINMAEVEVEESFETTTVRKKTVRQSFKIQEVSTTRKKVSENIGRSSISKFCDGTFRR